VDYEIGASDLLGNRVQANYRAVFDARDRAERLRTGLYRDGSRTEAEKVELEQIITAEVHAIADAVGLKRFERVHVARGFDGPFIATNGPELLVSAGNYDCSVAEDFRASVLHELGHREAGDPWRAPVTDAVTGSVLRRVAVAPRRLWAAHVSRRREFEADAFAVRHGAVTRINALSEYSGSLLPMRHRLSPFKTHPSNRRRLRRKERIRRAVRGGHGLDGLYRDDLDQS
jgi:hypothetical protein